MIQLPQVPLHPSAARYLDKWTLELTAEPSYDVRVKLAKKRFKSRNKRGSRTFDRIQSALHQMCNDTNRCVYCEDNLSDEVEHMRPKDIYPDQCFA
ncbi:MAG: hypothetical protein ACI8PZ_002989 [Myxococcota bacterium]